MKEYIVVDVGGTEIKSCLIDELGEKKSEILKTPSKAKCSREEIMDNFYWIIRTIAGESHGNIQGIAFAFPGEFDYERGISLLKNLDKYDAIYQVNVRETIREWICGSSIQNQFQNPKDMPIVFVNDVEGFAVGAAWNRRKAIAIVIGTGAGSAFIKNGQPAPKGEDGVPENGAIYDAPFRGKRIDDWISKRGIMELSKTFTGRAMEGAELAKCVEKGDPKAVAAYQQFGRLLKEAVEPYLVKFRPDVCILGGQIMNSFSFFGDILVKMCEELKIEIQVITKTSETTFNGLYRILIEERT